MKTKVTVEEVLEVLEDNYKKFEMTNGWFIKTKKQAYEDKLHNEGYKEAINAIKCYVKAMEEKEAKNNE